MNFKRYHVSRNLFDITAATSGKYVRDTDGTLGNYADTSATDYIDVSGISTLYPQYFTDERPERQWAAFYNSSKTFVSGFSGYNQAITVPNDVAYVRLTVDNNYVNNFTVSSSELDNYEPYSSEVWHDTPHYIHNTSTDTLTTLPAVLYPNDTTATVGVKGQMEQSSTPSPTSPVMPQGCGNKTANFFDYKTAYSSYLTDKDIVIAPSDMITKKNYFTAEEIGKTLTISAYAKNVTSNRVYIAANINSSVQTGNSIYADSQGTLSLTVTPTSTNDYFVLSYGSGGTYNTFNNMMLVKGSTVPSEFIPFGYKIPISSASTTTPVYLGEVETTRKIKKLVLTGQETYQNYSYSSTNGVQISNMLETLYRRTNGLCNIYPVSTAAGSTHCLWIGSGSNDRNLYFVSILSAMGLTDASEFKSWVAQQYANGTPVTVWYVLSSATTGIVNEPIRKIGDYADTVSGISIPTIAGANSFDVLTTLKPSEVDLTYHGWHDASVKEYDGSQWNE